MSAVLPRCPSSLNLNLTFAQKEKAWWTQGEEPWQVLATCVELSNALDAPDPAAFVSRLPVHQDGTCNGLQVSVSAVFFNFDPSCCSAASMWKDMAELFISFLLLFHSAEHSTTPRLAAMSRAHATSTSSQAQGLTVRRTSILPCLSRWTVPLPPYVPAVACPFL